MCCTCNCPELEKAVWRWGSIEVGAKVVAVIYLIEGIFQIFFTCVGFYRTLEGDRHFEQNPNFYLFILVLLTIFGTLYFLQVVSSAILLVGLTIKEKTAFIRIFLIFNYFFIADDIMQLTLYLLAYLSSHVAIPTGDLILCFIAVPFSIYSQIIVSSHYKQVRRAITGPVQSSPEQEDGFVNKYLRF